MGQDRFAYSMSSCEVKKWERLLIKCEGNKTPFFSSE